MRDMTKDCKADFTNWVQKTWGTRWKPQKKLWPKLQKEQTSLWCPVLLNFYICIMFPDYTFELLGSLFYVCVLQCNTNSRTRTFTATSLCQWYSLRCNIFFLCKGKLIIGSYRACDEPMPGNAECLGGVQDVLKAVRRERSLHGKW